MRHAKKNKKRPNAGEPWSKSDIARLIKFYPGFSNSDLVEKFGRTETAIRSLALKLELFKDHGGSFSPRRPFYYKLWTTRETNLLTKLYPTIPNAEIADILCRMHSAVQTRAAMLGIRKIEVWSKEEIKFLKKTYIKYNYKEVAKMMEQISQSIKAKARGIESKKAVLAKRPKRTVSAIKAKIIEMGLQRINLWADDEIAYLKNTYPEAGLRTIARKLGRTYRAVQSKAHKMGLLQSRSWNEREHSLLRKLYPTHSRHELAKILGRTPGSVQQRSHVLGLRKRLDWSKKEIQQLKKLYADHTAREIASIVGHPLYTVQGKANELGLRKIRYWSPKEIEYLKKHYPSESTRRIANKLGRKIVNVRIKASLLEIRKKA